MQKHDRVSKILEIAAKRRSIDIETTAKVMSLSAATIRRHFDKWTNHQHVRRTHGCSDAAGRAYDLRTQ